MFSNVAKSVIEAQRGQHRSQVFAHWSKPVTHIYNSGWQLAREKAAEPYARDHEEAVCWGLLRDCQPAGT